MKTGLQWFHTYADQKCGQPMTFEQKEAIELFLVSYLMKSEADLREAVRELEDAITYHLPDHIRPRNGLTKQGRIWRPKPVGDLRIYESDGPTLHELMNNVKENCNV